MVLLAPRMSTDIARLQFLDGPERRETAMVTVVLRLRAPPQEEIGSPMIIRKRVRTSTVGGRAPQKRQRKAPGRTVAAHCLQITLVKMMRCVAPDGGLPVSCPARKLPGSALQCFLSALIWREIWAASDGRLIHQRSCVRFAKSARCHAISSKIRPKHCQQSSNVRFASAVDQSSGRLRRSGSLAIFAAIRRALSFVSSLAAARTAGFFLVISEQILDAYSLLRDGAGVWERCNLSRARSTWPSML